MPEVVKLRATDSHRTITMRRIQGEFPFVLIGRTHNGQKLHYPKVEGVFVYNLMKVSPPFQSTAPDVFCRYFSAYFCVNNPDIMSLFFSSELRACF
jgi:hypothetical protein